MSNAPVIAPLTRHSPAVGLAEVTPSDGADLPIAPARVLYVGTAGDLRVTTVSGDTVTVANAAAGYHPLTVVRVHATGTTASDIVAIY